MSPEETKYTRKTKFIQKRFQTKVILQFVLLLIVASIISSTMLYFIAGGELESSYYEAHSQLKSTKEILLPTILITNMITVFIVAIAAVWIFLLISHRLAGPLYKVEKVVNDIADGNLDQDVYFRKADQIKNLATALDNAVTNLSDKISVLKALSDDFNLVERELDLLSNKQDVRGEEISKVHDMLIEKHKKLIDEFRTLKLKKNK